MADTTNSKSRITTLQTELESEIEDRGGVRREGQTVEQQDTNQGMDTGTHGSERHGVNWDPSYRTKRASGTSSKGAKRRDGKR